MWATVLACYAFLMVHIYGEFFEVQLNGKKKKKQNYKTNIKYSPKFYGYKLHSE